MTNTSRNIKRENKRINITLTLVFIILFLIIISLTGNINSYGDGEQELIDIKVVSGDTLWSIAKKYTDENTDIRKTINVIAKLNDLHSSEIYPGDVLKVPKVY